ncbi:MAG: hypothetical protein ACXAEU_11985 [Candidatus Hodarchaeales archaeon]|jgi:hypothetical protein
MQQTKKKAKIVLETDKKVLKDHQEFIPGRGVYDKRNDLNDKTGKEWRFATKSVIPREFNCVLGKNKYAIPTELSRNLVETFTKGGDKVIDPFVGYGNFLIACSLAKTTSSRSKQEKSRIAIGIGQSTFLKDMYLKITTDYPEIDPQEYFIGSISEFVKNYHYEEEFDLLICEIPIVKEQGNDDLNMENFQRNNGQFDIVSWGGGLTSKLKVIWPLLKKKRYMILVVPLDWFWYGIGKKQLYYYDLAYTVIRSAESCGAVLKSEITWFKDKSPGNFTAEVRKKILVFRKEVL